MAFGERKKMGDKYRTALTKTVLTYVETARQLNQDPLKMKNLPTVGSIVLGGELQKSFPNLSFGPKDSVWWIVVNPYTGKVQSRRKLANDLSKWRRKLNKQLKAWGEKSAVKRLATKRLAAAAIVAAVTTAVVVAVVLTAGGAAAGAGAAAAAKGGATATTATTAAAESKKLAGLFKGLKGIANEQSKNLLTQAFAAERAMPPEITKQVQQEAKDLPDTEGGLAVLRDNAPLVAGVGVVAAILLIIVIVRSRKEG